MTATQPSILVRFVIFALEDVFHVSEEEILSQRRTARIAWPRQVGMAALIDQCGYSTTEAAAAFRRTDHSTALHAVSTVQSRAKQSLYDRTKIREFLSRLAQLRQPV